MTLAPRQFKTSEPQQYASDTYVPETSVGESATAEMELAAQDTATGALSRLFSMRQLEAQTQYDAKLGPEDLNKKFPNLEKPFTEAKSYAVAKEVADRQQKRQQLENIVQAGPQNVGQSLINFGASMLPHMVDPLEIAAGVATGYTLELAGTAAKVGLASESALARGVSKVAINPITQNLFGAGTAIKNTGQVLAKDIAEGFVGNIATEPFAQAPAADLDQRKYDAQDAIFNAAVGAAGFTAIKTAGGKAIRFLRGTSEKAVKVQDSTATAQLLQDQKVDVSHTTEMVSKQTDIPDTQSKYNHTPILDNKQMAETNWHAPKDTVVQNIDQGGNAMMSDPYGPGVYMTDNPSVADAATVRGLEDHTGSVVEMKVNEDANVVDLDQKIVDPKFNEALDSTMERTGFNPPESPPVDISAKQYFDEMALNNPGKDFDHFTEVLAEEAQKRGIDGYRFISDSVGDSEHSPHNAMVVFNREKLTEGNVREPSKEAVRNPTPEELRKLQEAQDPILNHRDYSPEVMTKLDKNIENPQVQTPKPTEILKDADNIKEDLKHLDDQGLLSESDKKSVEKLQEDAKFADSIDKIAKQVIACVRANG